MKILIVVDMQNDFIDGALGTPEAMAIVPQVIQKIQSHKWLILATRDTHSDHYMETQEGHNLPVPHCIFGTPGWEIRAEIQELITEPPIDKPTFGSTDLGEKLLSIHQETPIESITLIGLCTDICVISNAVLVKAFLPEVPVIVDASCCAGVSPATHTQALEAMKLCQIQIEGEAL